ncbi:bifunctional pyr operon transcriptional regulator/uracil phosphoribosyltransferase PyrR [Alicyclobacillus sp. SP_1]|uniref:bifunctional pyr operon transcriptional regulator/uracil phosphoribosyltransferase PyrR n=1 Tax=Alicyclobacillus sp. SP_1 TaxID=2942475 RepID=UPI0035BE63A1
MTGSVQTEAQIMDGLAVSRSLTRIAHEILERNRTLDEMVLAGILTRGHFVAERLCQALERIEGMRPPLVALDVRPFRDDVARRGGHGAVESEDKHRFERKKVVLVDDVLFTGRTVRAALDALMAEGRATLVQLAVLVDRGHRELPIRPDFVGKNMPTSKEERIVVRFREVDGEDGVWIVKGSRANR